MVSNIELLLKNNFDYFLKLVKLGIISEDVACNAVVKEGNSQHIINFALEINYNIEALEDAIIETKDAKVIYRFAQVVKGTDILKLQDAIIKLGNLDVICKFAIHFNKEANIPKLEDALIAHYPYDYNIELDNIYQFALNVVGANILKLQDAIIEKGCTCSEIYSFAKDIKDADIEKLENAIIKSFKYSFDYFRAIKSVCKFALLPGADISKLEDAVINRGITAGIYEFARAVPNANVLKLEDAIIEIGDSRDLSYIYNFALSVPGTDISKLEDFVIRYDTGAYIYVFTYNVEGANKEKLNKARMDLSQYDKKLENINSKFRDNPTILKLLDLLAKEDDNTMLESQDTYANLFQEDKGVARKLEKNPN